MLDASKFRIAVLIISVFCCCSEILCKVRPVERHFFWHAIPRLGAVCWVLLGEDDTFTGSCRDVSLSVRRGIRFDGAESHNVRPVYCFSQSCIRLTSYMSYSGSTGSSNLTIRLCAMRMMIMLWCSTR